MAEHKIFITFLTFFSLDNVVVAALVVVAVGCHAQFNAQLSTQGALRLPLFHFWSRQRCLCCSRFFSCFFFSFCFLSQKFVLCKLFAATFVENHLKAKGSFTASRVGGGRAVAGSGGVVTCHVFM